MNIDARKKFIKAECDKLRNNVSLKGDRLSVDDKIAAFFDAGTFVETDAFVSESISFSNAFAADAEGVVTGYGAVNGRLVFCCIQDYSRDQGALSMAGAQKIANIYEMAEKNAAPVVTVYDCDGAKLADGVNAVAAVGKVLKVSADSKGIVPQIAVVTGVCSGGLAAVAENADLVVMGGKNAAISLSPVSVLKTHGANETVGSSAFAVQNGLAAVACDSEQAAFAKVRDILDYMPSNFAQGDVEIETEDPADRSTASVEAMLDSGLYDGSELVKLLADDGKFTELYNGMGDEFVVGFASVDGFACGIVAGNPAKNHKMTANGALKAAGFIDLCDSFGLPVITICDCDGYDADDEAKSPELAANVAALALAYAEAQIPLVTVIAGKLTGSAFSVLGSKAVGADMVFALSTAVVSPMSTESAVEFMMNDKLAAGMSKDELTDKWETELSSPVYAAKAGLIDYICEAEQLRARLAAALNMLCSKASF